MVWQPPEGRPVGILLLFHGCTHRASHFFKLPEERIIVNKALQLGLVALAFSSGDHVGHYCWDNSLPIEDNLDVRSVSAALQTFLSREGWTRLPLFAFGASSGGSFATVFPLKHPVLASTVQISAGTRGALELLTPSHVKTIYYSHMIRDHRTSEVIQSLVPKLVAKGLEVEILEIKPRPLTPTYFSEYISGLSHDDSKLMFAALKDKNFVTSKDDRHYLSADPRSNPRMLEILITINKKFPNELEEELNVLWGTHELSSDGCDLWLRKMLDHPARH